MVAASKGQLPVAKLADKLIVLLAFDKDEEGNLQPAFEPREMQDERRAVATARLMALNHAGVITWMREANLARGEYGPAEVLYQAGEVPDLD
ncbi:MAG: hypothetical protein EOP22_18025 [Hyphomicrobiales bacterium]|nr:MAG: hypothetical protein EOP22_18025 [Hyphomicrobiales bacterium]